MSRSKRNARGHRTPQELPIAAILGSNPFAATLRGNPLAGYPEHRMVTDSDSNGLGDRDANAETTASASQQPPNASANQA